MRCLLKQTYVVFALPRMVRLVLPLQVSASKSTQKRVELGMAIVYHNGSAWGGSRSHRLLANQRTRICCHYTVYSTEFRVDPRVWKEWYTVTLQVTFTSL